VDFFRIVAVVITLTALFSYVNHRWLGLPRAIGLLLMGLGISGVLVGVGRSFPGLERSALATVGAVDFDGLVLHGVLGFLLFAGALHLDLSDLRRHALVIGVLSTVGVVLSTAIVGWLMWRILALLGIALPLIHCLLFGALIAPTDPIAVLAILRSVRAPRDVEVQISGESLFNDGVGVVVFLALLRFADGAAHGVGVSAHAVGLLLLREAIGGIAFGAAIGAIAYVLIKGVDNYQVEILLSLALVVGGYPLAEALHVSAPIAMVVAGLLVGNPGRAFAMSEATRERLDDFWELLDEILNSVLFVLIGLLILTVVVTASHVIAGAAAIVVSLLARWASTGVLLVFLRRWVRVGAHSIPLMTWGGIRGPLSLALALSLHQRVVSSSRGATDVIVVMTYAVVVFSIAVQGLSLGPLIRRWLPRETAVPARRPGPPRREAS
jgi:CPA1 family monovalent cation:H+ antiporter